MPGTRAARTFEPADLEVIAAITNSALFDTARTWYRPRA
jgi:hypothetical protein